MLILKNILLYYLNLYIPFDLHLAENTFILLKASSDLASSCLTVLDWLVTELLIMNSMASTVVLIKLIEKKRFVNVFSSWPVAVLHVVIMYCVLRPKFLQSLNTDLHLFKFSVREVSTSLPKQQQNNCKRAQNNTVEKLVISW